MKEDDKRFVAERQQFFGWLFGLGAGVEIVSPERVRVKMQNELQKVLEKYNPDTD